MPGEGELNPALKALDRLDSNESFANFKTFHAALIADYLGNAIRAEASYRKAYEEASIVAARRPGLWQFPGAQRPRAPKPRRSTAAFLENDENPLIVAALDSSLKNVKPQPFIATPGAGAAEALFSLATSMTDEQSIDVALLYTQLGLSFGADQAGDVHAAGRHLRGHEALRQGASRPIRRCRPPRRSAPTPTWRSPSACSASTARTRRWTSSRQLIAREPEEL